MAVVPFSGSSDGGPIRDMGGGNPSGVNAPMGPQAPPNAWLPQYPAQSQMPSSTSAYAYQPFPANTGGSAAPQTNPTIPGIGTGGGVGSGSDLSRGLRDAGVPSDIAAFLANFINSGAGYNPQVLQAIFASLQPQIQRGQENIIEQFSAEGNRFGSPAAIGLGDFMSQVNLNEGQIAAQLYEQSVQNMLSILTGKQSQDQPGFWQGLGETLLGGAAGKLGGTAATDIGTLLTNALGL